MSNQNRGNIRQLPSFLFTQDFIKKEEGLRLTTYICPAAKTVGWGHAIEIYDGVNTGDAITEDEHCSPRTDIVKATRPFSAWFMPLTDNQQTALSRLSSTWGRAGSKRLPCSKSSTAEI
jgi:GH24 family phage-related lysozyme (muramidase)